MIRVHCTHSKSRPITNVVEGQDKEKGDFLIRWCEVTYFLFFLERTEELRLFKSQANTYEQREILPKIQDHIEDPSIYENASSVL